MSIARMLANRIGTRTALVAAPLAVSLAFSVHAGDGHRIVRAAAPDGAIEHILVINLENESENVTFGGCPADPPQGNANYLNCTLLKQGELIQNYYATSHVSLGNYIAEVSGQETNATLNSDCIDIASLASPPVVGQFTDVAPGTDADTSSDPQFAGQVVEAAASFPSPRATRTVPRRLAISWTRPITGVTAATAAATARSNATLSCGANMPRTWAMTRRGISVHRTPWAAPIARIQSSAPLI